MGTSLISASEEQCMTGVLMDHFSTFSGAVTIHKEPLKVVVAGSANYASYGGYERRRADVSYTEKPVSGIFPAIVGHEGKSSMDMELNQDGGFRVPQGKVTMKVLSDARDYIENGKTEYVTYNKQTFNVNSKAAEKQFLNLSFFEYELTQTQ